MSLNKLFFIIQLCSITFHNILTEIYYPSIVTQIYLLVSIYSIYLVKNLPLGTSLAVQWLRLHASTAGGMCSIPGRGTKIPHAVQ